MAKRSRVAVAASAVAIVAVTCFVLAGSAVAAFPGQNGKIAFVRSVAEGSAEARAIFTVNPDGSGETQLTDFTAFDGNPEWSPDGTRIAFASTRGEDDPLGCWPQCNYDIFVMNADGTGLTRLTDDPDYDLSPTWSPDGTLIAWDSFRSCCIWAMNADGSAERQLIDVPSGDPAWSPDGTRLAFTAGDESSSVHVINVDGTGERELPGEPGKDDISPDWSPDGSRIVFERVRYETFCNLRCHTLAFSDIFVINSDGSAAQKVTPTTNIDTMRRDQNPVWSPDGTRIAFGDEFRREADGSVTFGGISTMNPDGTGLAFVTSGVTDAEPSWQPIPIRGPQRSQFKNASKFCKEERQFLGDEAFRGRYGGGANAHGRCVRGG